MEIKLGKGKDEMTFGQLDVGKVFRANGYDQNCLFMKIKTQLGSTILALDLVDGLAIDMDDYQPVRVLDVHLVVG